MQINARVCLKLNYDGCAVAAEEHTDKRQHLIRSVGNAKIQHGRTKLR